MTKQTGSCVGFCSTGEQRQPELTHCSVWVLIQTRSNMVHKTPRRDVDPACFNVTLALLAYDSTLCWACQERIWAEPVSSYKSSYREREREGRKKERLCLTLGGIIFTQGGNILSSAGTNWPEIPTGGGGMLSFIGGLMTCVIHRGSWEM